MAGVTGLEPAAFCVTGRRYNQLNYTPEVLFKVRINVLIESGIVKLFFP